MKRYISMAFLIFFGSLFLAYAFISMTHDYVTGFEMVIILLLSILITLMIGVIELLRKR